MNNILIVLKIIQCNGAKPAKFRFNPYNPLSYLLYVIAAIFMILMFGLSNFITEYKNPFKY